MDIEIQCPAQLHNVGVATLARQDWGYSKHGTL